MGIRFLRPAKVELDESYAYYESHQTGLGQKFLDEVFFTINRIKMVQPLEKQDSERSRTARNSIFFL